MIQVSKFTSSQEDYYKVEKSRMHLVYFMISAAQYSNQLSERRLYKKIICICAAQARGVLVQVSKLKRHGAGQITPGLVSAHIGVGMWSDGKQAPEITLAVERFNEYLLTNVQAMLQSDWLDENIAEIYSEDKNTVAREALLDIFVTVPSILIELDRPREAEEFIKDVSKLLTKSPKELLVMGTLNLMLASMSINN